MGKRNNTSRVLGFSSGEPQVWKWEGNPKEFKFEGVPFERFGFDLDKDGDLTFLLSNSRRIGVSTMQLNKQLADYFGVAGGKGVLVTSVTEDGPAAKAGVKAGDVITAIDGEAVDSPGDLSRVIGRKKEGSVTLTVIRNKSQQTIQVTPGEGRGFSVAPGRSQVGRRIVIPRINIPQIEIEGPQIEIPAVPAVDVNVPPVRVRAPRVRMPRIRISGTVHGPI
ncbi:MAG TPA: PDZ domain-containing protein [Pyrinomonadaceae bacterium]|nr:PDZ domain-containing protein [Pyrinomonadaceae bacterium]